MPPAFPGLLGHDQAPADAQRRVALPVHHLHGVLPQPVLHAEAHEGPQARGDPARLEDREDLPLPVLCVRRLRRGRRGTRGVETEQDDVQEDREENTTKNKQTRNNKEKREREGEGNLGAVGLWVLSGAPGDLDAWLSPSPWASIPPFPAGAWPALLGWRWRGFCSARMVGCSSLPSAQILLLCPEMETRKGGGSSSQSQTTSACRALTDPSGGGG